MKSTRLVLIFATLTMAGCATSLGPSDNFNDWTNSASYHYQQPRSAVAAARHANDSDQRTAGE